MHTNSQVNTLCTWLWSKLLWIFVKLFLFLFKICLQHIHCTKILYTSSATSLDFSPLYMSETKLISSVNDIVLKRSLFENTELVQDFGLLISHTDIEINETLLFFFPSCLRSFLPSCLPSHLPAFFLFFSLPTPFLIFSLPFSILLSFICFFSQNVWFSIVCWFYFLFEVNMPIHTVSIQLHKNVFLNGGI